MREDKIIKSDYYYLAELKYDDLNFEPGTEKLLVIKEATKVILKEIFKEVADKFSYVAYGTLKPYFGIRKQAGVYFLVDVKLPEDEYLKLDKDLQKLFTKDALPTVRNANGTCCYCGQAIKD